MINKVGYLHQCVSALGHEASLKVTIKVGSKPAFLQALDEYFGGLFQTDPTKVATPTFFGVEVKVDQCLPPNMAAVILGGQLVQLIKFADD